MTSVLTHLVVWLNAGANAAGWLLLAPVAVLPGWLSATLFAAVTGVVLLVVFKYTSHQRTIQRVRSNINAHLLALKLFKDSATVALRAQGRVLLGAGQLFLLALVPMVVMTAPVVLILGQLSLWYQQRPLQVGEEAVVTLKLPGGADTPWPAVRLEPTPAVEIETGPVRVRSKREVCWNVIARENGYHRLEFWVDDQTWDKELAVGNGYMRVSVRRPAWSWSDALLYPWERPFAPGSSVESIQIDYPSRDSWTSGTDWWLIYWFGVSMLSALCFRRALNVKV